MALNEQKSPLILKDHTQHIITRGDGDDLELALQWDFFEGMDPVDLDAQAVMFDSIGNVVDAAFYNQLSACDGSVTHSGDNKTGEGEGDDEVIKIDLDTLPIIVETIIFVVTAYSGGTFAHVESANATLRDINSDGSKVPIVDISIGCHGDHTAIIMCAMHKNDNGQWFVMDLGTPTHGKNFQECITDIRAEVDKFLDEGLKDERVLSMDKTFTMHKDDSAILPEGCDCVIVGLGWTCPGSIDLDASIVCVDSNKGKQNIIYYGNKKGKGIIHAGDNTTGDGDGDDEMIKISLGEVDRNVAELYVTVNIYSSNTSFSQVRDAYVRLCVAKNSSNFDCGHELAKYPLDAKLNSRGLVFAKLERKDTNKWGITALGLGCGGATAADSACLSVIGIAGVSSNATASSAPPSSATVSSAPVRSGPPANQSDGGCCIII